MISSKRFESVDGTTSRFLSDFIIQSEQHCRVYMYKYNASCALDTTCDTIVGGVYVREVNAPQSADLVTLEKWDLVDNSIVFYVTPTSGVTIVIEVATTPEEFGDVVAMPIVALAQSYATSASLSATSATASALTATSQAGIATTQAGIATTKAGEALGSATTASNAAVASSNSATTSLAQAGISSINAASTAADVLLTHADVVLTHADATTCNTQAGITTTKASEANTSAINALASEVAAAASASILVIDIVPTDGSINAVSSNGTFDALAGKQNTLTIDATATDGSTNPIQSNAVFDGLALKAPLASPALTGTPTAPTATAGTNTTQIATTAFVLANAGSGSVSGIRQTVQSGSVDTSGFANFVSIGTGLAVNIAATTTPIVIHAAGGAISNDRLGTISADTSITGLTASATNYLFADIAVGGAVTLVANTVAHLEQPYATPAITNNLLTFNYSEMKGYLGNGATAPQVWRVPIGKAVTDATNVTSVVTYALNGMYDSGYTATLPATSSVTSKNHNIGTPDLIADFVIENTTINLGFAVGDRLVMTNGNSTSNASHSISNTKLTTTLAASSSTMALVPKTGGAAAAVTSTSWKYKLTVNRGW